MLTLILRQTRQATTTRQVRTLRQASAEFMRYTAGKSSSSLTENAGLVQDEAGSPVAMVSYNGRVWGAEVAGSARAGGKRYSSSMEREYVGAELDEAR